MSVVRLVVLSGLLLTSAILLHSSYQAYTLNLHHVLLLTATFTGLELTESSVLASLDETKKRLTSLENVGATIIVDDFGTGHGISQFIEYGGSCRGGGDSSAIGFTD